MGRGRKLESIEDFQRALKKGYGLGVRADYKPWLTVNDVKSQGTRTNVYGRKTQRVHHLLSSIETELFYLAEFSDTVVDIREQFPIIPLNFTQKVARTIGVKHPTHPKTNEPIVVTTDFLLTHQSGNSVKYQAISVKAEGETNNLRSMEKIDIERVCWQLLGVQFKLYTGSQLTRVESENISWASSPFRENVSCFSDTQIDLAIHELSVGQHFVSDICNRFIALNIVSHELALTLLRFLIVEKYMEVDLTSSIAETGVLIVKNIHSNSEMILYGNR